MALSVGSGSLCVSQSVSFSGCGKGAILQKRVEDDSFSLASATDTAGDWASHFASVNLCSHLYPDSLLGCTGMQLGKAHEGLSLVHLL